MAEDFVLNAAPSIAGQQGKDPDFVSQLDVRLVARRFKTLGCAFCAEQIFQGLSYLGLGLPADTMPGAAQRFPTCAGFLGP